MLTYRVKLIGCRTTGPISASSCNHVYILRSISRSTCSLLIRLSGLSKHFPRRSKSALDPHRFCLLHYQITCFVQLFILPALSWLQVRVRWAKKSLQYKSRLFTSIIYKFIFSKMAFAQYDVDCELKPPQSDVKQSAHSVDWQSTKKSVSERNRHMFNNSDMSDISFTCEGSDKILYAHKYVLGTSSAVFHAMFYGDLAEKNSVVHLCDKDEKSLEEFLRFLYTDACNLTTDSGVSVMYLSKKYIVPSLTEKCVNNLGK